MSGYDDHAVFIINLNSTLNMQKEVIWDQLISEQTALLDLIHPTWKSGYFKMSRILDHLPLVEDIAIPHWKVQPIVGKSPEDIFWYRLANGIFNVNQNLRTWENIKYLEERDYFHDVFGHLPSLHDKQYSAFIRALGIAAQYNKTEEFRKMLSNIYWHTAEFGLMTSDSTGQDIKAYGAGLISSTDELRYALLRNSPKVSYGKDASFDDIANITDYVVNGFQKFYLVVTRDDLKKIIKEIYSRI